MYDLSALDAALSNSPSGSIYAGKMHFAPVTGSTNADALAAAREGAPHGSVYFADEQTAGRGRGDHSWESAAGQGLYASVAFASGHENGTFAGYSAGRGAGRGKRH